VNVAAHAAGWLRVGIMAESTNPLRVCQVLISDSGGGLEKHFLEISHEMAKSCLVLAVGDADNQEKLPGEISFSPINVHTSRWNPAIYWRLFRILKDFQPDIVHAHGNRTAKILARIRPFLTAKCLATVHWHLRKKRNRTAYDQLDGVIGVSEAVLSNLKNPVRTVIHNGVPLCSVPWARHSLCSTYALDPGKPLAIAVGRMTRGKGFDVLTRAWQDIDANLLLVGDGPMMNDLRALVADLGLEARVRLLGRVDGAVRMFPAADLVVIPSLAEGFSYVLAEALVHRKPVIATSGVSGARELMPEQLLVPPGDAQALHAAVRAYLDAPGDYYAKLSSLYDWAARHLTLSAMTHATMDFYRELLER
jgi:glycosyltransferase involved in cell wall biosynthesis